MTVTWISQFKADIQLFNTISILMSASSKPIHRKCFESKQQKIVQKQQIVKEKKKYKTTNMKKARLNSDSQQF